MANNRSNIKQMRNTFFVFLLLIGISSCNTKEKQNQDFKEFQIEGIDSPYNLKFHFPNNIRSIDELTEEQKMDTSNLKMNWILDMYFQFPEGFGFFDPNEPNLSIFIQAGKRVDINSSERNKTYFSVPTVSLDKVFSPEIENGSMIYDSGKKTYKDKTYYQRTYQIKQSDSSNIINSYYVSTEFQSVIIIVKDSKRDRMKEYLLDYEVYKK
jgi:hypothetical protein